MTKNFAIGIAAVVGFTGGVVSNILIPNGEGLLTGALGGVVTVVAMLATYTIIRRLTR